MITKSRHLLVCFCLIAFWAESALAIGKSGQQFNTLQDVHFEEIQWEFEGICICPRPPPIFFETGIIVHYWEPFLAADTVSEAWYSPYQGDYILGGGGVVDELGGKNASQDAISISNESTFAQAHGWLVPMMSGNCKRNDYGLYLSEYDPLWQNDELNEIINPEAALYANRAMQLACMADAAATNLGFPLDFMPWCMGSSGSSYPMTGHVDNDNIVQANNSAAGRMIYRLNRLGLTCDYAINLCGCLPTPVWIKSHYKMHVVRPDDRSPAWPVGVSANLYQAGLNPSYMGVKGSNDEFLWVVYRLQRCCTCCD